MIRRYRPQDSNLDPAFGLYCGPHHFVEPGFELHTHDFIEMVIVLRGSGLHLSAAQLKTVARQVDGINQELHSRQPGYLAMVKAAWQQLLTWLCRMFSQPEDAPTGFARLADTIAYMEQHYAESLSLEALADRSQSGASRKRFLSTVLCRLLLYRLSDDLERKSAAMGCTNCPSRCDWESAK